MTHTLNTRPVLALVFFLALSLSQVAYAQAYAPRMEGRPSGEWLYTLGQGEQFSDTFSILPTSGDLLTHVYSVDRVYREDGGYYYARPYGEKNYHVGNWIALDEEVMIAQGETKSFPITFTIPEDTPPGEYQGAIVVGPPRDDTLLAEGGSKSAAQIAYPVKLTITGEPKPTPKWLIEEVKEEEVAPKPGAQREVRPSQATGGGGFMIGGAEEEAGGMGGLLVPLLFVVIVLLAILVVVILLRRPKNPSNQPGDLS